MSEATFELTAEPRIDVGKGASRRLRRTANKIPAIIYGTGKTPMMIMLSHDDVSHALEHEGFYSHILTLHIDKTDEQVVLKDLQRHPCKRQILHMDFLRIKAGEKLTMTVPIHFINEDIAPGVKIDSGQVMHLINELEIRCLPKDLPEYIEVDLSNLNLNESISFSEIALPKGVELVVLLSEDAEDASVVSIQKARVTEEPEEPAVPESAEVPTAKEAESTEGEQKTDK